MTRIQLASAFLLLAGCNRVSPTREAPVQALASTTTVSATAVSTSGADAVTETATLAASPEFETLEIPEGLGVPAAGSNAGAPRTRTKVLASAEPTASAAPTASAEPTTSVAKKKCPPIKVLRCAHCKPMRCVDGAWIADAEPAKKCESPPPPCAGAPGVCSVFKCVNGQWVEGPRGRIEEMPRPRA